MSFAVDLYLASPERCAAPDVAARTLSLLTADERKRHDAFRFDVHRTEYLATRALALAVLSAHAGVEPGALRFARNAYGCPRLASHDGIEFNLTNATTMVACLVSRRGPVGVDLEPVARADTILEVASTVFAPSELAALLALGELDARRDRGLDLWTLKESYIKARGMGLALDLAAFAFDFAGRAPSLTVQPSIDDRAARWAFTRHDVDGHRISTCVEVAGDDQTDPVPAEVRVHRIVPFVDAVALG